MLLTTHNVLIVNVFLSLSIALYSLRFAKVKYFYSASNGNLTHLSKTLEKNNFYFKTYTPILKKGYICLYISILYSIFNF